jgi:DNA-binding CsgD family transcriptional regulator
VVVVFITGPGGIGKSRLLRASLGALDEGVVVVPLDCREIEPTPAGFTAALTGAVGLQRAGAGIPDVAAHIASGGRRTVLALDSYERFGLMDTWLRQVLVPSLPESVLVIIAGRDAPGTQWVSAPGWAGLVREVRLSPLPQAVSIELLRTRGLTELQAARVNAFARGHPLALELAAAALRVDPVLEIALGPPPSVIRQLLDVVLAGLSPRIVETLEASATSRRVTEPLLRSLLARSSVRDEFHELERLPFVERTPEGLMIHDLVREALAADLRERDPERHAACRRRAWSYFEARARRPAPERLWAVTADLIYLIENPVLRSACFPLGSTEHAVEPAVEGDGPAIREILARHEQPGAAALLGRWWDRQPGTFRVARGPDGEVAAILQLCELGDLDPSLIAADPVAQAWHTHLAAVPPRPGDRVLVMRRWLGRESGEMLSAAVGSCWLDVKRVYMELRPRLSRLYSAMGDPEALAPIFVPLGFAPVGGPVDVAGSLQHPVWLDFGEGSVDGWLRRLVGAEIDAQEAALAPAGEQAAAAGLTARELEVLVLLAEGLSNRGIGERLVISEKTAGRHVSNIFCKLGVHSRAQAVGAAASRGIVGSRPPGTAEDGAFAR